MALDFPASPTNGQAYDNYYYDSILGAWRSSGTKSGLNNRVSTLETKTTLITARVTTLESTTVPAIATRTTDLETADNTTNKSGLVPIIPTSISYSSGSANVSSNGEITFTSASSLSIYGVFTSSYRNYRIMWRAGSSASAEWFSYRLISGASTVNTTTAADCLYQSSNTSGGPTRAYFTGENPGRLLTNGNYTSAWSIDVFNPNVGLYTSFACIGQYMNSGSMEAGTLHSTHKANASYTGINLISSGTVTGTMTIYGYR
jgi:hypothetical protein